MKRILALGIFAAIGLAAMAQTCIVTNESLTTIDDNDVFAGELQNDSGVNILQHRYRIAFLNSNGAVVQSFTVDGCLRSLPDGGSDFFSATSSLPDESTTIGLARLANLAEDPNFTVGTVENGDIVLSDVTAERDGTTLTVEGTVTNEDDDELEEPVVCAVVWNEDGRVVTTGKDTTIDDLAENESAQFSIDIAVPDDDDQVNEVDVWADGLEDDVPVEPGSEEDIAVGDAGTPAPTNTATPTATATP
ncbi:MAG: FxLYD domain-containing protein [Dehalococcoidia bacterium]